ncbi:MAG: SGNH/GDSL hydrolase family protein [Chitinophagales bacterium]|nr:SGNH/GDSL hydrolase family protein [Chitinophagales bacterium]
MILHIRLVKVLLGLVVLVLALLVVNYIGVLEGESQLLSELNSRFLVRMRLLKPSGTTYFIPDASVLGLDSFHLEKKKYYYKVDSNGCIVTDANHQHPDLQIAFFGGSTVQCLFVDEGKRMPEVFTRHLEALTGKKINVFNAAAGGSHSQHTINVLVNNLFDKRLDYAFFYANLNDIGVLAHYGKYNNMNPEKGIFFNVEAYAALKGKSSEGFLGGVKNYFEAITGKTAYDEFKDVRGNQLITDSTIVLSQVEQALIQIIAICKARQIQPVFVTEVNVMKMLSKSWYSRNMPVFQPTDEEYQQFLVLITQYNNLIVRLCHEQNIQVIDMRNFDTGFQYFYDAVHFNTRGSEKFGTDLANRFYKEYMAL